MGKRIYRFYNIPTLTVEEVMTESYSDIDLPRDINEGFAFMTPLLLADESQVAKCREFIREHCDPVCLQLYDIYWAGRDENRCLIITDLQDLSNINVENNEKKL